MRISDWSSDVCSSDLTDLVVIVGHDLVDDKYFNIAQQTGATATEVEATDRIPRSTKQLGGLPAVRVPFFPADAVLITTLKNLAITWQEGTPRSEERRVGKGCGRTVRSGGLGET